MRPVALLVALFFGGLLIAQDSSRAEPELSGEGAVTLPEAPKPSPHHATPRVIDKKFIVTMAALGAAESMRFTTRKLVIEHEFAAGAPWISQVPCNPPIIAKDLGLYASEWLVAYEMKKKHSWLPGDGVIRRLWWVYPVAMTAVHVKNGVGNIRTRGPGGCTSIQCTMPPP